MEEGTAVGKKDEWLEKARHAYHQSTEFWTNNLKNRVENNLRHFQSKHHLGSKYLNTNYNYRSRVFRPKTRSSTRNKEAAASAAFFSNQDVVSVSTEQPESPEHVAGADLAQQIMQYRLTKTVPWFPTCLGAYQDAQVVGVCVSYQDWDYEERIDEYEEYDVDEAGEPIINGETGEIDKITTKKPVVITDGPMIELIPLEQLRISPGAKWIDPINTSPYLIHIMPMYVIDVREKMRVADSKMGEPKWKSLTDAEISSATKQTYDTTKSEREDHREDSGETAESVVLKDFEIVWVHRNLMKKGGQDYVFYTLGTEYMLTQPQPIEEAYPHLKSGERPYVMGYSIIETHKNYPAGDVEIGTPIQKELNEVINQRLDNVKFVLNKGWFVQPGSMVDLKSLRRNVPGGITMAESQSAVWPKEFSDVTSSAFQEQDRLNADFDEVVGNFSSGSVQTNRKMNETVGGMQMLRGNANALMEYGIRTFSETWAEPVLRQILGLIQQYETDEVILALCADKAGLFQKYGQDIQLDKLLENRLTLTVNVGMGATDPLMKVQHFMMVMNGIKEIATEAPPGLNLPEVVKEMMGRVGYKDGSRFWQFDQGADPDKAKMVQAIQQLQGIIGEMQKKAGDETADRMTKLLMVKTKEEGLDRRLAETNKVEIMKKAMDLRNPVPGERPQAGE